MLNFRSGDRSLVIELNGEPLVTHNTATPMFATGDAAPEVRLSGGAWTLSSHVLPEKPLTRVALDEVHGIVRFGSPRRWISMSIEERQDAVALKLEGASRSFGRLTLTLYGSVDKPIYGGGRSGNLRGEKLTLWESDRAFTPADTMREALGREASAVSAPLGFFVWDDGCYVALRSSGGIEADFTHRVRRRFEMWGLPDEIIIGRAPSNEEALRRVSLIGVSRKVPPRWAVEGVTVGVVGGEQELLRRLDRVARTGMRPSAVHIRDWSGASADGRPFRDYEPSAALYPRLGELITRLRSRGIRSIARVTPQLDPASVAYHEASRMGLLLTDGRGAPLLTNIDGMCAHIDLSNPAARAWAADKLESKVLSLGFSALDAAGAAALPPNISCLSGSTSTLHNRWPKLWLEVCADAAKRTGAVVFSSNAPSFAVMGAVCGSPAAWQLGDGVASTLRAISGQAAVGAGLCFADASAGMLAAPPNLRSLQFVRFAELAAFTPHFRLPAIEDSSFALDVSDFGLVAKMARLHNRLAPYIAVLISEYASGGLPPLRPVSILCPEAPSGQLFLGEDLTVAPVGTVEADSAEIVLPDGAWVRLLGGGDYTGGKHRVQSVPGNPAAFYRRDSEHANFFRSISRETEI